MSVPSVSIAKERLKNLLISDRMHCTPDLADHLTKELYHLINKYIELNPEEFDVQITRTNIHITYTGESK